MLIDINLDFRSKKPLSTQIQAAIEVKLASGALLPGDQLPTVRELAGQLNVNFNTIARAYRALDAAGILSTRQGRGTFITAPARLETEHQPKDHQQRLVDFARAALARAASQHISPIELIQTIQQISKDSQAGYSVPAVERRSRWRKHLRRKSTVGRGQITPSSRRHKRATVYKRR